MTSEPPPDALIAALRAVNIARGRSANGNPQAFDDSAVASLPAALRGAIRAARHRLATYGTLAPGEVNHHVVRELGGTWTRGRVRGILRPRGWGATLGFPALTWDPGGDPVAVQLLASAALEEAWPDLDAFEGEGYLRILIPVVIGERHRAGDPDSGADLVVANLYASRREPQR